MDRPEIILAPGPTPIPPEVLLAQGSPLVYHRGPGFGSLMRDVTARLKELYRTEDADVLLMTSSGTGGLESAIQNVFSPGDEKDPLAYWKANYPDSEGLEVLAILTEVLEAPLVHVDKGTPQDMYLWPYFARMQLKDLTPEQKVGLFRLVTGTDYRDMLEFGAYNFYRLGIAPDGTWHFFVTGD